MPATLLLQGVAEILKNAIRLSGHVTLKEPEDGHNISASHEPVI